MSSSGIGTLVLVHNVSGPDTPCVVVVTHDTWTEAMGEDPYDLPQPDEGQVYLCNLGTWQGASSGSPVSAGTGTGEYSLMTSEVADA